VLDLGCGNGIPAAKWLSDNGFRVTGVESAGLTIDDERIVPEGASAHTLFVATLG